LENADKHQSSVVIASEKSFVFKHQLNDTEYFVKIESNQDSKVLQSEAHYFVLSPDTKESTLEFSVMFSEKISKESNPNFTNTLLSTKVAWKTFGVLVLRLILLEVATHEPMNWSEELSFRSI